MLDQSGLSAFTARFAVDIRRLPWVRRLPADYAFEFDRLARFFAGNPSDADAWRDAIARTTRHVRSRDAIADVLLAQQRRRGASPEAIAVTNQLRDSRTVAVVTGQQATLFGGPMFTLLKALSAIQIAERVRAEHHVPAVAVFWIDAEDHDWDEVKSCGILDSESAYRSVTLADAHGAGSEAVGRIRLDASIDAATIELESLLQSTEFTPRLLDGVRAAYRDGATMADAFGQWIERLLGSRGLLVYDSSDREAKPLVSHLFAREIEFAGATARRAVDAGAALEGLGYHTQAAPGGGSLAIFRVRDGRESIRASGDGFSIGGEVQAKSALVEHVRRAPEDFSPTVLLRPLVQDTLFPTVCYVAGPNELAYLGQLKEVYAVFGIPMPLIHQRATATLLDSNASRFLARYGLPFEALQAQDEAALNALVEASLPPDVDSALQEARRAVAEGMTAVVREVPRIDPTLEGAARSTLTRMQDDLEKLNSKIIQATKRKNETLRRQFHHAQAQAFPAGQPQERAIGFIYFLNKYGPTLVERLYHELPLTMGAHWVITA